MTLFPATDGPRVFGLPPGVDFTAALIAGLEIRLRDHPPEALARVEIWVNTERAKRALLAGLTGGPARLLPRLRVLTDLSGSLPGAPVLPPAAPPLRTKLELARLITALGAAEGAVSAEAAAFDLAESLADLLDTMEGEGIPLDAFGAVDAGEHAEHWQRSLRFLGLISTYAEAAGPIGGQARMRAAVASLAARWEGTPPRHPVIVAGSTGSRGATRAFMAAVARLPQGAIVLPGYDGLLAADVWARLDRDEPGATDHPQFGFRQLAATLGFEPGAVAPWTAITPPAPERNALVSLAMRPAPVTDQWRAEGGLLRPDLAAAARRLTWIEAADEKREALAIALLLRESADGGRRAALITTDRTLARRVTAELDRWGLIPDDSAGRPLSLTPPGVLLRLVASALGAALTPEALLALLKHPLVASGPGARGPHLGFVDRLERRALRGGPPWIVWEALAARAEDFGEGAEARLAWLRATLAPLEAARAAALSAHVALHRATLEALARGPEGGEHALWEKAAGIGALALLDELAAEAEAGGTLSPHGYQALIASLMTGRDVPEEAVVTHPGIAIWGTLEARVQAADRVILGGLNEGVWPRLPGADPWLDRRLRRQIGLPSPETTVGLAAHDFQQAMGAAEVVVARATRDAEAPTVASRWLLRLENLLAGLPPEGPAALAEARTRGDAWLALADRLAAPGAPVPPARRPAPRPPAAARPRRLSVSDVDQLMRDPYAVYAARVLRLRRLDPPGRSADPMTRGEAIHAALEDFVERTTAGLGPEAEAIFAEALTRALDTAAPWPAIRTLWSERILRVGRWFLGGETERRQFAEPLAREIAGRMTLPCGIAIIARADRIDRAPDGYAIYDYKTGSTPTKADAARRYLQLPIEAAMAAAGGFEGLGAAPVVRLELIRFGGDPEVIRLDSGNEALEGIMARLDTLLAYYLGPDAGFVARLRPARLSFGGDYDHLSRFAEWADGDPSDVETWT